MMPCSLRYNVLYTYGICEFMPITLINLSSAIPKNLNDDDYNTI